MSSLRSFIVAVAFLCLVAKGRSACTLNDLTIGTVRTGRMTDGKPEWQVTVTNECSCPQSFVKLRCPGFKSVVTPDPSKFLPQGDLCLINGGNPLASHSTVSFAYVWDPPFIMLPDSANYGAGC